MEGVVYKTKTVDFMGEIRRVLHQDGSALCPIVALGNALLLKGSIEVHDDEVREQQLVLKIYQLLRPKLKKDKGKLMTALNLLIKPIDISVDFTRVEGFKSSMDEIFAYAGIGVYHGWIVHPENTKIASVVGSNFHNVINAQNPTATTNPIKDAGEAVQNYLMGTGLTTYGLQLLKQRTEDQLTDGEICLLFWRKHLHPSLMWNGHLFLLQNDTKFLSGTILWRELNILRNGDTFLDGYFKPQSTVPLLHAADKCDKRGCSYEFSSKLNLKRHMQSHSQERKATMDILKSRSMLGKFWDGLGYEHCSQILSFSDAQIEGVHIQVLLRILQSIVSRADHQSSVAKDLLNILTGSVVTISSNELFDLLDKGSEHTFLCFDIRDKSFGMGPREIICNSANVIACCTYLVEKNLMETKASSLGKVLIDEEQARKKHMCSKGKCSKEFYSLVNLRRHELVHSKDLEGFLQHKPAIGDFWDGLSHEQARSILSLGDTVIEGSMDVQGVQGSILIQALEQNVSKTGLRCSVIAKDMLDIISGSTKKTSSELFSILDKASEKTSFSHDTILLGNATVAPYSLSDTLALCGYMIEMNLIKKWTDHNVSKELENKAKFEKKEDSPEKSNSDEIDEGCPRQSAQQDDHQLPPSDCILLEEFVRKNRLIKACKLRPRKLFKKLKKKLKAFKLFFNILTYAGRMCARGYMKFIIKAHRSQRSWNGDWDLSQMKVRGGSFFISKEPGYVLTVDTMMEDFKKYAELLFPYYRSDRIPEYPFYFNELKDDILKVPHPDREPEKLDLFQKYMALHWAFMPPSSRSTLVDKLYKACESQIFKPETSFTALSLATVTDWRTDVRVVPLFMNVYQHRSCYDMSTWDLLTYSRYFVVHVRDYTKEDGVQLIQDTAIIDFLLAQLLGCYLPKLILDVLYCCKLDGVFYDIWQKFEASDAEVEFFKENDKDDLSEDDSSDDE